MKGGTVQINWHEGEPVLTLDFHSPSGLLATAGTDEGYEIKLWTINPTEPQKKIPSVSYQNSLTYHKSAVNILRFSPSGEHLASGADGGVLATWELDSHCWKIHKALQFHCKDVLDLQWSADGAFLISGSVDNNCIIWDVKKGEVHQILDAHLHYVQGVAWDPLGQYVASLSSDRTCRVYVKKPQPKGKGLHYVCQHVLTKFEPQKQDDSKQPVAKTYLFHDETLPSFFRRLQWSPDGSFMIVPTGIHKFSSASETVNTAYVISRKDLSRPVIQLPGASKPIVVVRFCPILFHLRGSNSASFFKLPHRIIFAVATLDSLYVYDTEGIDPIAIFAGLHYAAITDISWSSDAKYLALSSKDGYCTVIEFENDELGQPCSPPETKSATNGTDTPKNLNPEVIESMEIDTPQEVAKTNEKADTCIPKEKKIQTSSVQNSDSNKSVNKPKKRITPTAIP